jgi:co-chaperonin GroES (HSP10)
MEQKLKPLNDVVLIEKDMPHETASGIALPESYKDPAGTDSGRVVSINWRYINEYGIAVLPQVAVDDRVLFLRKHGIVVKGSKTMVAVRQENLLAVYEE